MQLREFNRGVREATGIFLSDPWGVQAKYVRHGVESGAIEQNREILQSILTTFACTRSLPRRQNSTGIW